MSDLHVVERARERYGVELTEGDINDLCRRCRHGEGLVETAPCGKQYHNVIFGDRVLWLIYKPPHDGRPLGVLLTAMPSRVALARTHRDHKFKQARVRKRRGHRPGYDR